MSFNFNLTRKRKGTISICIFMSLILIAYQNCGKKDLATSLNNGNQALTTPPTNVVVDVASLVDCPNSGLSIITYIDVNLNGKLDEEEVIKSTKSVCNGANGTSGTNGADGKSGGIIVSAAPRGSCSAGGIQVTTFVDDNNNGILDNMETITSKSNVCNGVDGSNGVDGESSQITVTRATSAQCSAGGVVYTTSTDSTEPVSTVICNGKDGENGSNGVNSSVSQAVASPAQCPTGGTVIATSTDNSDPVYSVICNGAKGDTGANGMNGQSAYITTSIANPFQCSTGGVVISTWTDPVNPATEVICNGANGTNGSNGANGASAYITTAAANNLQCPNGGFVITTSTDKTSPVTNIVCNGATGAMGATGNSGSNGVSYTIGNVGPIVSGKNFSACHHDFMYFPATGSATTGWLVFRHQKNGNEDQGVGTTGFNVWNVDIANFALISEVGNVTYCNLTYDPKNLTLQYSVVDKTDGLAGKSGTINLKDPKN